MKNKWKIFIVGILCLANVPAIASDWMTNYRDDEGSVNRGIGIRLGIAKNNPESGKHLYDTAFNYADERELTKRKGVVGLETLYERAFNEEVNKLGFKIGVEGYGQNKLDLKNSYFNVHFTAKENTYALPITVYYKRDNGINKLSWMAGAGVTIMRSEIEAKTNWNNEKLHKTKIFPHIMAGAEYRFSRLFALGLEARYNIGAKIKKNYEGKSIILSNRSGIVAAVTGRFYF